MSNRKSIIFLLIAIGVLCFINFAMSEKRQRRSSRSLAHRTLLAPSVNVSRIEIARAGRPVLEMERETEWRIVRPFVGGVDKKSVAQLIDRLKFEQATNEMTDAELLKLGRVRADYRLVDPPVKVTLHGASSTSTISFGSLTPSADGGVYAAVDGIDSVFVVPTEVLAAVDRPADEFRRRSLFESDLGAVKSFDIKRGGGTMLSFVRSGAEWLAGGERASEQKVREFLDAMMAANAVEFVWPKSESEETVQASNSLLSGYGLDPESAVTVILKGEDGSEHQVSFGRNADEKLVYALVQNGGAVVTIPAELRDCAAQEQRKFADTRLFTIDANSVAFISLAEKDNDLVCSLARDANGNWALESPIVAAANNEAVEGMLARILALSTADIAESGVSVAITTNVAPVKVANEAVFGRDNFESLRSLEMVRVDPLIVKRITRVSAADGPESVSVIYSRERKLWNVETSDSSAAIDAEGVETVLAAINPLTAEKVARLKVPAGSMADYGFDKPFMRLAIDQNREDAVRKNIIVGNRTKGGRFATVGSMDAVFVISDQTVKNLSTTIVKR